MLCQKLDDDAMYDGMQFPSCWINKANDYYNAYNFSFNFIYMSMYPGIVRLNYQDG